MRKFFRMIVIFDCCLSAVYPLYGQESESGLKGGGAPIISECTGSDGITQITLASGKKCFLYGHFDVRKDLPGIYSLLYESEDVQHGFGWFAINPGNVEPRLMWCTDPPTDEVAYRPAVSMDGNTCFVWLGVDKQLMAIDLASGIMHRLTYLPALVWNYEGHRHLDPGPAERWFGSRSLIHDMQANRILMVLEQLPNKDVFFWQRRPGRGGYQLVAIDLKDASMTALTGPKRLPGEVLSWDLSLNRKEMYILSELKGETSLEVRDYSGKLLRNLPLPKGIPDRIRLSPKEETLLIQMNPSGLVLLNLDTNEPVLGPADAKNAVWSPDGQKIAYLKPWELWIYHITSKKSSLLASREPTNTYQNCPYSQEPVWYRDGTMLAVNIGGDILKGSRKVDAPTLLLSLKEGAVMIFPEYAENMIWLPNPHALPY